MDLRLIVGWLHPLRKHRKSSEGFLQIMLANWSSHNILWTWGVVSFIAVTLIESALDHNSFRCHQCHAARSRPFVTVGLGSGPFTSSMCSSCTVELHLVTPTHHWKIRASWPFQKAVGGFPLSKMRFLLVTWESLAFLEGKNYEPWEKDWSQTTSALATLQPPFHDCEKSQRLRPLPSANPPANIPATTGRSCPQAVPIRTSQVIQPFSSVRWFTFCFFALVVFFGQYHERERWGEIHTPKCYLCHKHVLTMSIPENKLKKSASKLNTI